MSLYQIGEVFGHALDDNSRGARKDQANCWCPFRNSPCRKGSAADPLGICSLTERYTLAVVCPVRFIEDARVFKDVGRLAFGAGVRVIAAPEVRILRVKQADAKGKPEQHKIGKVDYLVAKLDSHDKPVDFAALEVQAVYFSGASIRAAFKHFLRHRKLPQGSGRRPDWRSSAQKRLMPQLSLKIPVFRRWGKKFFVCVDYNFYSSLPPMKTIATVANSEITWLAYPFPKQGHAHKMGTAVNHFTTWDDVETALREGEPPDPAEILDEISGKMDAGGLRVHTT